MTEPAKLWLTTGLFTITYAGLAAGKVPKLRLDRPVRIEITGVTLRPLQGLAADGRAVTLSVTGGELCVPN